MWATLDGYQLRLPRSGNVLITAQSPGTGRRASLRRPDGSLAPSSVRFIGRVVGSSTRIGALRGTGPNRRCPVFTAEVNGRHYQTVTGPSATPGELVILAVRPEVRRFSGEFSDGRGHRIVQDSIYDWLVSRGLQHSDLLSTAAKQAGEGIRDNQAQLRGLQGRPFPNKPDISYIAAGPGGRPRRVNVEIDTDPRVSTNHERTLIANDPTSMHVFVVVDPISGRVLNRRVYDPVRDRVTRTTRPHTATLSLPAPLQRQGSLLPRTSLRAPRSRPRVQTARPGEGAVPRNLAGLRFLPMSGGRPFPSSRGTPGPQLGPAQQSLQFPAQQSLFPRGPRRELEWEGFF